MGVRAKDVAASFLKRERFANEFESSGSVGCKNNSVTCRGFEVLKDCLSGFVGTCGRETRSVRGKMCQPYVQRVNVNKHSRIAYGMSVSKDVLLKKFGMDADEALRIERATHVIYVGFASPIESCEVASSERVKNPR